MAVKFVTETKGHFVIRPTEPTLMNLFFPEYCIPENDKENQYEFTCPVWAAKKISRGEPTVLASAVGATKSGTHFELEKIDDAVTDKNSESIEQCKTISDKLFLAKRLLRLGGFYTDFVGTRYDDEDHYGILLEKNQLGAVTCTKLPCIEIYENEDTATKILIGRGIVIKPETIHKLQAEGKQITYKEAGEAGCDLLIPKVMPFSWLMKEWAENEVVFEGQINQNPRPSSSTTFERKDLVAATVTYQEMPQSGPRSQTWDFAFSVKKGRDFSTGSSVIWNEKGQFFLEDLIRARLKHNDLAQAVVDFAKKWHPFVIGIENAGNSEWLADPIMEKARQTGDEQVMAVCSKIEWIKVDTSADSKRMRMGALHPPIMEGRFKIGGSYFDPLLLNTIYEEFERCMTSRSGRNDIPDVVSQQLRYAPRMASMIEKKEISTWSAQDSEWNIIYENGDPWGRPGWALPPPLVNYNPEPEVPKENYGGLENILGAGLFG